MKIDKKVSFGETTICNFENLKFPDIVYKYRSATEPLHWDVLTKRILFLSAPKMFEDTKDCRNPDRYDLLSDDEIYQKYYDVIQVHNPLWDPILVRNETIKHFNKGFLKNTERLLAIEENDWEELNERFGILSLTEENDNLKMWNKYSNNMNGFCVGFNSKVLFKQFGGGGKVSYVKTLPIINPFDSYDRKRVLLTFFKLNKWKFEKEYRLQMFWPNKINDEDRKIIYPGDCLSEIIMGENLSQNSISRIKDLSEKTQGDINLKIAVKQKDSISILQFN